MGCNTVASRLQRSAQQYPECFSTILPKRNMDVEDFTHEFRPHHKRSRLLEFREQILTLKRRGYSDMQIRQWLAQNGCQVSRENVRRFIKRYLPELDGAASSARGPWPEAEESHEQVPHLAQQPSCDTHGSGSKETAAERILRQTREQRSEATQSLFKHDKTGNNH
jgi:hypothetical protein